MGPVLPRPRSLSASTPRRAGDVPDLCFRGRHDGSITTCLDDRLEPLGDSVNRYYDPTTAQFVSVDPGSVVSGSDYGYVDDNPINKIDPSGLCPWGSRTGLYRRR